MRNPDPSGVLALAGIIANAAAQYATILAQKPEEL